ncbi:unnamed protein product [Cuscuta europaea]|uniref:Uncharacterized protein n=1 Tax=Cuscuta europaea TaxID=41803 RepID=A0A9P0YIM4_CUSEU|nr:unnamed protein product [Cuscuta europaea]
MIILWMMICMLEFLRAVFRDIFINKTLL